MSGSPPQQQASPGGPTSPGGTTATAGSVAMTIILLFALPALVYYLWYCLTFNRGQPMLPSPEMLN